jgi:ADP-heptose:LPS heptosyltransferase
MQTPAAAATEILTWFGNRSLAVIDSEIRLMTNSHAILHAAEIIADAANSDDERLRSDGLQALFAGVVEPLNDSFTPAGRAVYARVFGHMVWHVISRTPNLLAALTETGVTSLAALLARHHRLRTTTTPAPAQAKRIMVLSRVTIGADILLSSVVLQRLHQRYPAAELILLGDGKLAGLFGGLPHVRVRPISYARRGPLRERLASWLTVRDAVREEAPDLVVAPDSRLDQLGILPVCAEANYFLWENLQAGQASVRSLATLLDEWMADRLSLPRLPTVVPRVALSSSAHGIHTTLRAAFGKKPIAAIKLDHGGNAAKSLPRSAEVAMLKQFRDRGWRILLDRGFGSEELANSDDLLKEAGWTACDIDDSDKGLGISVATLTAEQLAQHDVIRFHGSISGWAAALACCGQAFSYDSVGHHLAGALGVPVLVAFTGFSDPGFPIAWQPRGRAAISIFTIPTAEKSQAHTWKPVLDAIPQV